MRANAVYVRRCHSNGLSDTGRSDPTVIRVSNRRSLEDKRQEGVKAEETLVSNHPRGHKRKQGVKTEEALTFNRRPQGHTKLVEEGTEKASTSNRRLREDSMVEEDITAYNRRPLDNRKQEREEIEKAITTNSKPQRTRKREREKEEQTINDGPVHKACCVEDLKEPMTLTNVHKGNVAPIHATKSIIQGMLSLFMKRSSPPPPLQKKSQEESQSEPKDEPCSAVTVSKKKTHTALKPLQLISNHPQGQSQKQLCLALKVSQPALDQLQSTRPILKICPSKPVARVLNFDDEKENIPPEMIPSAVLALKSFREEVKQERGSSALPPPPHAVRRVAPKDFGDLTTGTAVLTKPAKSNTCRPPARPEERSSTRVKKKGAARKRRSHRNDAGSGNVLVTREHLEWFLKLVEEPVIRQFLETDICRRYADRYLLAMVFTYFVRAFFVKDQYTQHNFFAALYLAHDMEEDEEELKYEVFPWALGDRWRKLYPAILHARDDIFWDIHCRAVVSKRCCDQVIEMEPDHWLWQRERPSYHGGAVRDHLKHPSDDGHPRGPQKSPLQCQWCLERECTYSQSSYLLYLSESEDTPESSCLVEGQTLEHCERDSGFETFLCDSSLISPPLPSSDIKKKPAPEDDRDRQVGNSECVLDGNLGGSQVRGRGGDGVGGGSSVEVAGSYGGDGNSQDGSSSKVRGHPQTSVGKSQNVGCCGCSEDGWLAQGGGGSSQVGVNAKTKGHKHSGSDKSEIVDRSDGGVNSQESRSLVIAVPPKQHKHLEIPVGPHCTTVTSWTNCYKEVCVCSQAGVHLEAPSRNVEAGQHEQVREGRKKTEEKQMKQDGRDKYAEQKYDRQLKRPNTEQVNYEGKLGKDRQINDTQQEKHGGQSKYTEQMKYEEQMRKDGEVRNGHGTDIGTSTTQTNDVKSKRRVYEEEDDQIFDHAKSLTHESSTQTQPELEMCNKTVQEPPGDRKMIKHANDQKESKLIRQTSSKMLVQAHTKARWMTGHVESQKDNKMSRQNVRELIEAQNGGRIKKEEMENDIMCPSQQDMMCRENEEEGMWVSYSQADTIPSNSPDY